MMLALEARWSLSPMNSNTFMLNFRQDPLSGLAPTLCVSKGKTARESERRISMPLRGAKGEVSNRGHGCLFHDINAAVRRSWEFRHGKLRHGDKVQLWTPANHIDFLVSFFWMLGVPQWVILFLSRAACSFPWKPYPSRHLIYQGLHGEFYWMFLSPPPHFNGITFLLLFPLNKKEALER